MKLFSKVMLHFCLSTAAIFAGSIPDSLWPGDQFESQYVEVQGSNIHYVEQGEGDPILLVHGIPTSSYLWRNMIEPLSQHGRVIAVDMIGYGKSDKPNLTYSLADLRVYMEGFIDSLQLKNITLVVHDLGGPVALPLLKKRSELFKGLVAFETIFGPLAADSPNEFQRMINDKDGLEGPGAQGYDLIVRQNIFVNMLPQFMPTTVDLTPYQLPFENSADRFAIYNPYQDIPVDKIPRKDYRVQKKSLKHLRKSALPKLYIYPDPGFATAMPEGSPAMAETFKNTDIEYFGPGGHFLQEENPEKLASIISKWLSNL
ncbi:MAG: alpha/beta fold hydrolase [Fibrobacterales bacterium]